MATNRETRNKKFMSTDKHVRCGGSGSCSTTSSDLWCRNGNHLDIENLVACPAEYDDIGPEWSNSCKNPLIANPKLRRCDKKPVTDPVFNILETEYEDKTKRTDLLLQEMTECCTGDENSNRCGNLWEGLKNNEPLCNSFRKQICMKSVDTLNDPDCIKWCKENPLICSPSVIKEKCKDAKPGDPTYSNLCGCYYPESFYINLREELATKWNIPPEFLSGGKSCYSSACGGSDLIPPNDRVKCKEVSLSQCNQIINVQGTKIVLGSNAFTQNADCQNAISIIKKGSSKSCTKDSECGSLKCSSVTRQCEASPTAKPCSTNEQCSGGLICTSGKCIAANSGGDLGGGDLGDDSKLDNEDPCEGDDDCTSLYCSPETKKCAIKPEPKSNLPLIIGLSVGGGLVLLLIIAAVLFKMTSSSSSSTGTSTGA